MVEQTFEARKCRRRLDHGPLPNISQRIYARRVSRALRKTAVKARSLPIDRRAAFPRGQRGWEGDEDFLGRRHWWHPLLLEAGHHVAGTTRSAAKADALQAAGAVPVAGEVFDAAALSRAVAAAQLDIVVHRLTDLPAGLDPSQMAEGVKRNARLRERRTLWPQRWPRARCGSSPRALPGCMPRGRSPTTRTTRSTSTPRVRAPSARPASWLWSVWSCRRRRSPAWCCATAISTGRAAALRLRARGRGCTSMRLPRPPCPRSRRAAVASYNIAEPSG